jgi:hypothetical protein
MKLITEISQDSFQVITEAKEDGKKDLFIEGVFMQADVKNRNGRVYPKAILEKEVNRYIKTHVNEKRALGELGHPQGPKINEDRVSHLITELYFEGSDVYGKAKILSTPMGNIVRSFVEDGVKIGVSSRGLGSLKEKNGVNEVQNDFFLATVDVVTDPSAPNCFVNGIMEGVDFWYDPSKGIWTQKEAEAIERIVEETKKAVKKMSKGQILENKLALFNHYLQEITKKSTK